MTKRFKLIMIILIAVLIAVFAMSIGLTAAIWTSGGAGSGENTVAPAVDSPEDWNPWAKYFGGVIINENTVEAVITSFHTDGYGLNLETVIIPSYITIDGKSCKVVEFGNQVFSDVTLKELPVTVYISPYVTKINAMAFANLPNLEKVVFGVDGNGAGAECVVEDFSFALCGKLAQIVTNGRTVLDANGSALSAGSSAFTGCADGLTVA